MNLLTNHTGNFNIYTAKTTYIQASNDKISHNHVTDKLLRGTNTVAIVTYNLIQETLPLQIRFHIGNSIYLSLVH